MSEYIVKEVNCETGKEVVRNMTPQEITARKAEEKLSEV